MTAGEERDARMVLAAVSEPADVITSTLIARVGAVSTVELIANRLSLPSDIDTAEGELWRRRLAPRIHPDELDQQRAAMDAANLRVLTPADADWPTELNQLGSTAPIALWLHGAPESLHAPLPGRVTITGAQAATAYGSHLARELAADLSRRGRVILAGSSHGIDADAHFGALAAGPTATIAVLASGLGRPQSAGHDDFHERIASGGGLLISELPPGASPTRWRFLQRGRLLAALAGSTVVVEAGRRSASLNVAAIAHALGRPVAALPGPLTSPTSAGTHALIQSGTATLITGADDLIRLTDPAVRYAVDRPFATANPHRGLPDGRRRLR
ncbi:DNA-processing protein DprA [Agromyces agglutinans]|uniref:DNA-processing protein DprA n=1 Tax=Agromyces agglutinans TaxID=2662258 RepID=UPI001562DD8C|nr:DNA-processing protein DprA [Agromyces agglutinans]